MVRGRYGILGRYIPKLLYKCLIKEKLFNLLINIIGRLKCGITNMILPGVKSLFGRRDCLQKRIGDGQIGLLLIKCRIPVSYFREKIITNIPNGMIPFLFLEKRFL